MRAACASSDRKRTASSATTDGVNAAWAYSGTTVRPATRLTMPNALTLMNRRAIQYVSGESR